MDAFIDLGCGIASHDDDFEVLFENYCAKVKYMCELVSDDVLLAYLHVILPAAEARGLIHWVREGPIQ